MILCRIKTLLALAFTLWMLSPGHSFADVRYLVGVESLIGKTSTETTLDGLIVRVGKFQTGFTPTAANYNIWLTNFINLTTNETLVVDPDSFATVTAPETGPWKMSGKTFLIANGAEPSGFNQGDKLYIWISNATVAGPSTEATLLTDAAWTYTTADPFPQTDQILTLSNPTPVLLVGTLFEDQSPVSDSESGVRMVTENVTGANPQPVIALEQEPETPIAQGAQSIVDFGTADVGDSMTKTIVIKNLGATDLMLTSPAVTLDNVTPTGNTDLTLLTPPTTTTIAPGFSTTFTLQYAPTAVGALTAQVHVGSDDPTQPLFTFSIHANAIQHTGMLKMATNWMTIPEQDGVIQLRILRVDALLGSISVNVSTANGSATAPFDYRAITNQLVTFADGESFKDVPVTIYSNGGNEPDETFTVSLDVTDIGASAAPLTTPTTTTVQISDAVDTVKPKVPLLFTPAANSEIGLATGESTNVTGLARDNKGIMKVEVTLNDGEPVEATLIRTTAVNEVNFELPIIPNSGPNTLTVYSYDTQGQRSPKVTRTFTVSRPLVVNLDGSGTVTTNFAPTSFRLVGKKYTITATPDQDPAPGFLFDGWTANDPTGTGITPEKQELRTLTFTHQEGLILTAKFTPNTFAVVSGTYNGLVTPSATQPTPSGTPTTIGTTGFYKARLTKTGGFTGRLYLDGLSLPVSGFFDNTGTARFTKGRKTTLSIPRKNLPDESLVVALRLDSDLPQSTAIISGTVSQVDRVGVVAISDVDADRAFYNGKTPTTTVPDAFLNVSGTKKKTGKFVAIMPVKPLAAQPSGFLKTQFPQGVGYATIKVTKSGRVTAVGRLADGWPMTSTTTLSKALTWPLFARPYKPGGVVSAEVALEVQTDTDMTTTNFLWLRPRINTARYPYGWPEGIQAEFLAAKHVPATGSSILKTNTGADLSAEDTDGNAQLTWTDGLLAATVTKAINLSVKDAVTRIPTADRTFSLKISPQTGLFSGKFTHTDDTKPKFSGIIYPRGPMIGGHGYFLSTSPRIPDFAGEAGKVTLIGQ